MWRCRSWPNHSFNLHRRTHRESRHGDRRSRRIRRLEMASVDFVYFGEVLFFSEENPGFDDISKGLPRRFENRTDIAKYLFGLRADVARNQFTGGRIECDLST